MMRPGSLLSVSLVHHQAATRYSQIGNPVPEMMLAVVERSEPTAVLPGRPWRRFGSVTANTLPSAGSGIGS